MSAAAFDFDEYRYQLVLARKEDKSASNEHRNIKCPKCDMVQSATHKKCSNCGHDLTQARKAKFAKLSLAADSLAKAATPEPFSTSRTSNWVARAGGLPPYIQHIAHDLLEKGRVADESEAIEMAIGIVKHPPKNWGAQARAAAALAASEWEAMKAKSAAKSVTRDHLASTRSK